jgi:hypothetical protein
VPLRDVNVSCSVWLGMKGSGLCWEEALHLSTLEVAMVSAVSLKVNLRIACGVVKVRSEVWYSSVLSGTVHTPVQIKGLSWSGIVFKLLGPFLQSQEDKDYVFPEFFP